jgi:superfamily II DNA or RNA helicase
MRLLPVKVPNNADSHERYGEARKVRLSLYDGGEKRRECATVAIHYPKGLHHPREVIVFRGSVEQARELAQRLAPIVDAWFFSSGGKVKGAENEHHD